MCDAVNERGVAWVRARVETDRAVVYNSILVVVGCCCTNTHTTVLGAPRADQHRFRRAFEWWGAVVDAVNERGVVWVRARVGDDRALIYNSMLT